VKHGSLFSGVGGFDLAAEWMGWENVFHCEWMEFPRKVLDYYWPEADSHIDICKTDFKPYADRIDILTGGFPCQPFSTAGKRKGTNDERYLWGEMLRAIQEIKPRYVVAENVFGITNIDGGMVFEQVCLDLESEGYEVQPFVIPAAAKNAPHRRDRVWFVAHTVNGGYSSGLAKDEKENGIQGINRSAMESWQSYGASVSSNAADTDSRRLERSEEIGWNGINAIRESKFGNATDTDCNGFNECDCKYEEQSSEGGINAFDDFDKNDGESDATNTNKIRFSAKMENGELERRKRFTISNERNAWHSFPTQSPVCRRNDGLSTKLDGITFPKWRAESIKGYGNAIVPQVALEIFKAIQERDNCRHSPDFHKS
jgi:DNA (cytosine-5)-methyltransferase 1